MATITLSAITIPAKGTRTPGKDAYNQEMFYGVLLDILTAMKAAGWTFSDQPAGTTVDLTALVQAVEGLQYNGAELDLGDLIIRLSARTTTIETL